MGGGRIAVHTASTGAQAQNGAARSHVPRTDKGEMPMNATVQTMAAEHLQVLLDLLLKMSPKQFNHFMRSIQAQKEEARR